jgi:hypothetical protein
MEEEVADVNHAEGVRQMLVETGTASMRPTCPLGEARAECALRQQRHQRCG